MLSSNVIPLVGSALLGIAAAATNTEHATIMNTKRGLMSCEETYGAGWVRCGPETSTFCFNPSEGQVGEPLYQGDNGVRRYRRQ